MKKNILIVHYNTPELTTATVLSVKKHTPGCRIIIFDNSNMRPFPEMEGVEIIDNTRGQVINFDKWLAGYPEKLTTATNWGSEKHIFSIQTVFDRMNDGFVLLDSDVLVKKDLSSFFDDSLAWRGKVEYKPQFWFQAQRLFPFLLWVNVPMCKRAGVKFMSEGRIYKVSHTGAPYYDTGGSFYWDCKNAGLPSEEVEIGKYIEHMFAGSHHRSEEDVSAWLNQYRDLYE